MERPEARVEPLISADEIHRRVDDLAARITQDMGPRVVLVAILKGSFIFAADLVRGLHYAGMQPRIDFLTLSSYGKGKTSSGEVTVLRDISEEVAGCKVLLIDDILESGTTLTFARQLMLSRGATDVRLCVLLDKQGKRKNDLEADYVGFVCPDKFVVGYGLDYAHYFRELPYIGAVVD